MRESFDRLFSIEGRVGEGNPGKRVGSAQVLALLAAVRGSRPGESAVGQVIASDGGLVGSA